MTIKTDSTGFEAEIKIRHGKFIHAKIVVGPTEPGPSFTLSTVHIWQRVAEEAKRQLTHAQDVYRSVDSEERTKAEKLPQIRQWMTDTGMPAKAIDKAMARLARYGIHSEVWAPFMSEKERAKAKANASKVTSKVTDEATDEAVKIVDDIGAAIDRTMARLDPPEQGKKFFDKATLVEPIKNVSKSSNLKGGVKN